MKDYYQILGVKKTASEEEIKKRYRVLAHKYHPDVSLIKDAEEIFKDINEAYAVLSDSLKRADYDQELEQGFVRRKEAEKEAGYKEPEKPTLGMFVASFARTFFVGFVGVVAGVLIEFLIWVLGKQPALELQQFYPSIFWAGIAGLLLGADMNFNVESFLGSGYLGRTYTFLRTFLYALSFAFFGARIFGALNLIFKSQSWLPVAGLALGIVLGATFGSDGDGLRKLYQKEGRFNLFYTGIRAVEVGLIGFLVASVLGFTIQLVNPAFAPLWPSFFGLFLGVIVGATSPPNLAAYASYASAAVKNIIIILMVGVAAIAGIAFGYIFQPQIQNLVKIFIK